MHHFFVQMEQITDHQISISGKDVNHIKNVLRMKIGEEMLVSGSDGSSYCCKIRSLSQDQVETEILYKRTKDTELPAKLYLFQGLPKGDKMEMVVQKAVELGVFEIIPVTTKRTVVKLDQKKEGSKIKRWNNISESAAKQSMRTVIPKVKGVMNFPEAILYAGGFSCNMIPYENEKGIEETREMVSQIKPGMEVGVFIGPEGGFEEEEILFAREHGVKPITLGKRILRTETAGLTMLSVLMFQLEQD